MARIRSLKPEFATSESIAALDKVVRLHFAMLWTYADDEGRGLDNPRLIKAALWPLDDDVTPDDVEAWQAQLADRARIVRYEVGGRRCFEVVNWHEHQHPQKSKPSLLPPPPDIDTGPVRDESETGPGRVASVGEGRVEGVGAGEGEVAPPDASSTALVLAEPVAPQAARRSDVVVVFDAWREATGRNGRTQLDAKRRRLITKALKDYPVADVVDAVRGWRNSPFHRGENDRSQPYNDLGLLLRDSEHIEKFRDCERSGGTVAVPSSWHVLQEMSG